jgi:ubiquinone/menaquinone biosynthesis C-methylase UbiE
MLSEARTLLAAYPQVQLIEGEIGMGEAIVLRFAPGFFDLITCTNALHALPAPLETLVGLRRLLAPGGQLVLEDFARREAPFPWKAFEWLVRQVVGRPVQVYTLAQAQSLCLKAGLQNVGGKAFTIDWLLRGWALCAQAPALEN